MKDIVSKRTQPLNRERLDRSRCQMPNCSHQHEQGPLTLRSRCCASPAMHVTYYAGLLTVACAKCGKPVACIEVAE